MKNVITGCLAILQTSFLFASTVSGVIVDENSKPVEYSNIIVHKYSDPDYLNGTTTDSAGKFSIQVPDNDKYFLEAVYLGYTADTIENIILKDNEDIDLGTIQLGVGENALADVQVSAFRPIIERKADRLIYNVENSAKANGENVLDLLRSVPGVTVSGTDQIRINGKSEVQIMINGKVEQMSVDQLANLLKSMQSSNVKKIEVVSNPSAKYDASAKGGLLDIVLKTNQNTGVNGSVYMNYRQNRKSSFDAGFNLSMNHKKLTLSTNYNHSYNNNLNTTDFVRNFDQGDNIEQYDQNTRDEAKFVGHYANLNLRYAINDNNALSIGGELFRFYNPHDAFAKLKIYDDVSNGMISSYQETQNNSYGKAINPSASLNFKSTLDSSGSTLTVAYDYTFFRLFTSGHLNTSFFDDNYMEVGEPQDFTQENPFNVNLHTTKLDYYKPLKNKNSLELGGKFTWTKTHNDVQFANLVDDEYVPDPVKSNEFQYTENINAAYAIWNKEWNKGWSTNLGLRMEETNTNQYSITLDSRTKRSYVDFFPSAFIQKNFKDKHSLNINYSRKIHRPDFKDLNPFQFYNSQYSIWTGNSNLKSEYINITELTYTYDNAYSFFVGFENVMNNYTYLAYQDDSTKITTYQATNFKVRNNLKFGVQINKDITKWWSFSFQTQYTFFKYSSVVYNEVFDLQSNKFEMSMDNTFRLPKEFQINIFGFFSSPFLDATDMMKCNGMVNASISKTFFDKKLRVRLFGNDIFATLNNSYVTKFGNVDSEQHTRFSASFFGAAVSYNFQKGKKFQNQRVNKSNEEEKSRVQ